MRRALSISALCLLLPAFGCNQPAQPRARMTNTKPAPKVRTSDMRTIDDIPPQPVVMQPPPVLRDEAPPPKPLAQPWETPEPVKLTPDDEKIRAALPFAPAIALDPVDGSKISILATTPTFEYKGRVFYFSSDENKRTFMANPDQYAKGGFAHL